MPPAPVLPVPTADADAETLRRRVAALEAQLLAAGRPAPDAAVAAGPDVVSRHAPDGAFRYASAAAFDLLGHSPAELVGASVFALVHPDDADRLARHFARAEPGGPACVLHRLRHRDGRYRWVETAAHRTDPGEIVCVTRDVTDRPDVRDALRDAERAARHAAAPYAAAADASDDLIAVFSPGLRYVACNPALVAFTREAYGQAARPGLALDRLLGGHPAHLDALRRPLAAALGGASSRTRMAGVLRSGERREFEAAFFPVRGADGAVEGAAHILRDVTRQAHAERDAHERAALLQRLLDNAPVAMGLVELEEDDVRLLSGNEATWRFLGGGPEGVVGRRLSALGAPPEALAWWRAAYAAAKGAGRPHRAPYRSRRGDFEAAVSFAHTTPEGADRFVYSFVDVTEERHRAAELDERRSFIEGVAQAVPGVLHVFDPATERTLYANRPLASLLGYDDAATAALGDDALRDLLHPDDHAAVRAHLAELVTAPDGTVRAVEYRARGADGAYRWLHCQKTVLRRGPDGQPTALVGVTQNVHDQRTAADVLAAYAADLERTKGALEGQAARLRHTVAELDRARQAAEDAAHAKSAFLATMSHEIRTPLNGVLGMAQLLATTALDADQREFVETLQTSGHALAVLIDDVLDVSKIEAGRVTLERVPFDPRALAADAVRLARPPADAKGLAVRVAVAEAVPTDLVGDPNRLRQVLTNLLSNAVKFTERGEVALVLDARPDGDAVVLDVAVTDTGIGIGPEGQAALFRPFTQADTSTTRRFGGTGLGLSICRSLVELMGGAIGVTSVPGEGATFRFTARLAAAPVRVPAAPIPLHAPAPAAPVPAPPVERPAPARAALGVVAPAVAEATPAASATAPSTPGVPPLALVADAQPLGRRVLRLLLERRGWTVAEWDGGPVPAGVAVAFVDVGTPGFDGEGLRAALRARPEGPYLVALTGGAAGVPAGFDGALGTPVRPDTLAAVFAALARPAAA